MARSLPSIQASEVMIFNTLAINNHTNGQKVVIKGYDIHDRDLKGDLMEWWFESKTVPLKNLETLKSGDLLFWNDGELTPVPFDTAQENVRVFSKVFK
jgi:hypothetical protein